MKCSTFKGRSREKLSLRLKLNYILISFVVRILGHKALLPNAQRNMSIKKTKICVNYGKVCQKHGGYSIHNITVKHISKSLTAIMEPP